MRSCWRDDGDVHPRPHRLDRHGQVDHREIFRRGRRAGARFRRGGASPLRRRGGAADRGGISRYGRGGKVDRGKLAAAWSATQTHSSAWRRSCTRWCATCLGRFLDEARAARRAAVDRARYPAAVRDRRRRPVDAVVVVSAPAEVQRARVLARPGMTAEKLEAMLARQMSDAEKRARAHFVVDSRARFDSARAQVHGDLARRLRPLMPKRR